MSDVAVAAAFVGLWPFVQHVNGRTELYDCIIITSRLDLLTQ